MNARIIVIPHLDGVTLFSSWTKLGPLLNCVARKYVRNSTKHHLQQVWSPYISGRGLFCELIGLYQYNDTSSKFFFVLQPSANLRPRKRLQPQQSKNNFQIYAPSWTRTHNKTERWWGRNGLRQQRLVRFVDKLIITTAPTSNVGPFNAQNIISTRRILQKRPNQGTALASDSEFAIESHDEELILPFKPLQKCQRMGVSDKETQQRIRLTSTTTRKARSNRRKTFVAHFSKENNLCNDAQRDVPPVGCIKEASLENGVWQH